MIMRPFKTHEIVRSSPTPRSHYRDYKEDLIRDFGGRCAYCNLRRDSITTFFEIDHFIPKKVFEGKRDDLLTDYNNLVLACKKCNLAKGKKFEGDISLPDPKNERFYDPVETDYNTIFFRNDFGCISSHDQKGQQMIEDIRLYRPIHILGWVCEYLKNTIKKAESKIDETDNDEAKNKLAVAAQEMKNQHFELYSRFIASYNDKSFSLE